MTILKIDEKNEIYYEYIPPKNNGLTCVFVNALTGDTSTWTNQICKNIIENDYGYLVFNFRGQRNTKFDNSKDITANLIVNDLINLINFVEVKKPVLIGLSIGGLYAAMAIEKGVKPEGLVLINTLRKPSERLNWINQAAANAVGFGGTAIIMDLLMPVIASPQFLEKYKENALNPKNYKALEFNEGVNNLMRNSCSTDWNFNWDTIKTSTLVMTGHFDRVFRVQEDIDEIIKRIKNSIRIEITECGHLIPIEDPKLFSFHLLSFLNHLDVVER